MHHASTRKSVACFGAVSLITGQFVRMMCTIFNAATFLSFLKRLMRQKTSGRRMILVLDNARYHPVSVMTWTPPALRASGCATLRGGSASVTKLREVNMAIIAAIARIGLDIAKQVFQVHGVDARDQPRLRKQLKRAMVLEFFTQLPPCEIGIEPCGGAHYWSRELMKLGHTVKLMAPHYVIPYRTRGKNDANDAEAICEAMSRPKTRFVATKSEEQQYS